MQKKKVAFFDLDGTVRQSKSNPGGFIQGFEDIELIPHAVKFMRECKRKDYLMIGITNQGGVAHGYKTIAQVELENSHTKGLIASHTLRGTALQMEEIYYCPSEPSGNDPKYGHHSLCRKPNIGMLALAEVELFRKGIIIQWDMSFMVGDRPEDAGLADNANIRFFHIDYIKTHIETGEIFNDLFLSE